MTRFSESVTRWVYLFAALALPAAMIGAAEGQEISFKGKVNVIIGTTPGGGTDGTTRLIGRFMTKYLPGHPQMIYRNMPGGGGVKGTNYFANKLKRDGSAWMGGGTGYVHHQTLRLNVVKYDPRTFNFIGGVSRGGLAAGRRTCEDPVGSRSNRPLRSSPSVRTGIGPVVAPV